MKIYNTTTGIIIGYENRFYHTADNNWDSFINDDGVMEKCQLLIRSGKLRITEMIEDNIILAPVQNQELWACGVTYLISKEGRQEESKEAGGGDFYAKVYEAERPEIFFKSAPHRIVGHGGKVRIRKDSGWNVPEPELTLVVTSSGKIIGYTIGNDMSSRSIEGENPLYLPQAKTYDGCAALGPCVYVTKQPLPTNTMIHMRITRNNDLIFKGSVAISQMKRSVQELVSFVYRECTFPNGCLIMTGTGIVPGNDFTLYPADAISMTIDGIGTLINTVGS